MTTPLSTRSIVWGKWLGSYRKVAWLVVLPTLLAAAEACNGRADDRDAWLNVVLLCLEVLAYGAFVTSLGLALATWVPHPGRAALLCVGIYVLLTVGSFFSLLMFLHRVDDERWLAVSSFGGPAIMTVEAAGGRPPRSNRFSFDPSYTGWLAHTYRFELVAISAYATAAALLLLATLRTFDRCLGRASGWSPPPLHSNFARHVAPDSPPI
jgi:hypothetical protein